MLKTAEFVSPMHPDKMCDQISDAILDFCLSQDPDSRVAMETMGGHGEVKVTGELTTKATITNKDIENIIHRITGKDEKVSVNIVKQSPEISQGVDIGGAGDQGIMVGYACNENEEMIPQEEYLARSLNKYIFKEYNYDGKTQITLNDKNEIETIFASFQNVSKGELEDEVNNWLEDNNLGLVDNVYCNPAGDWSQGGFDADTGLTGRKLIVDNYGPQISIGGGCFSGKDATKVDRSGAYMARYIAKELLKEYKAKIVKTKIAYAIGIAEPVMANAFIIFEDGTFKEIDLLKDTRFPLTPKEMITFLGLKLPIYEETARWGHFGNNFEWDK